MTGERQIQVTLQPKGVAAPALKASTFAAEVVGTSLRALDADPCVQPESWGGDFGYRFQDHWLSPDERRREFKNWILARGFQDLTRGVRETLEEAYLYISVWREHGGQTINFKYLQDTMDQAKRSARFKKFPELLGKVNECLQEPLAFEAEFMSLQKLRNCLEHRGGCISESDIDDGEKSLMLSFPRMMLFYNRQGEECELKVGEIIDTWAPENSALTGEVQVLARLATRQRHYELGDRVVIDEKDFFEIAMACHFFASDLAAKLPGVQRI